jgi:capsular polysaccharide biosynthesis protein
LGALILEISYYINLLKRNALFIILFLVFGVTIILLGYQNYAPQQYEANITLWVNLGADTSRELYLGTELIKDIRNYVRTDGFAALVKEDLERFNPGKSLIKDGIRDYMIFNDTPGTRTFSIGYRDATPQEATTVLKSIVSVLQQEIKKNYHENVLIIVDNKDYSAYPTTLSLKKLVAFAFVLSMGCAFLIVLIKDMIFQPVE